MDTKRIDHVNLRIPEDGVEQAFAFYRDLPGMAVEGYDEFRAGERVTDGREQRVKNVYLDG